MIRCLSCGAESTNGLALCDLCQRRANAYLEFIPVHFRNLSRWRPGRAGSRPTPGSREPADLVNSTSGDQVSRALDETGNALTTRARELEKDRDLTCPGGDTEADQAASVCRFLAQNLTSISTLDWCGDLVTELGQMEGRLNYLTQRFAPGWYAGACQTCEAPTYVVPGLTWVTCVRLATVTDDEGKPHTVDRGCGATTYARDHIDVMLAEAGDWVERPRRIAEAVVALLDTEQSADRLVERIEKWDQRGQIKSTRRRDKDGDPTGPKMVRLGDVLDRLASEGQTRTGPRNARRRAS